MPHSRSFDYVRDRRSCWFGYIYSERTAAHNPRRAIALNAISVSPFPAICRRDLRDGCYSLPDYTFCGAVRSRSISTPRCFRRPEGWNARSRREQCMRLARHDQRRPPLAISGRRAAGRSASGFAIPTSLLAVRLNLAGFKPILIVARQACSPCRNRPTRFMVSRL